MITGRCWRCKRRFKLGGLRGPTRIPIHPVKPEGATVCPGSGFPPSIRKV